MVSGAATAIDPPIDPPIDKQRTALLVMDYQVGILARLGDREEAQIERAAAVLDVARAAGLRVGYVRVAFEPADVAAVPATNANFAAAAAGLAADAPETQVHARLAPHAGDIVVRKTRVGAFSTTDLDAQLRSAGVHTIVLAGISTSGVVLSTVRDGADRDYRIVVLADGCADFDAEVHDVLMHRVFPRQAQVVDIADLRAALS
ncbi:MAG TPA: cysteine hydrolase [Acidimicrobiia bacterium]